MFRYRFQRMYCTVQYTMEASDFNSVEPTKFMWAVFWILVRPVEIGSRCQLADAGSDSGYSLVLGLFEKNEGDHSNGR